MDFGRCNGLRLLTGSYSCHHECSLLFCEPLGIVWEITDEEKCCYADEYSRKSFEDEDPAPICQSADSVHVCDSAREETTERGGYYHGAKVNCETLLGLFSLVPHTYDVKA